MKDITNKQNEMLMFTLTKKKKKKKKEKKKMISIAVSLCAVTSDHISVVAVNSNAHNPYAFVFIHTI